MKRGEKTKRFERDWLIILGFAFIGLVAVLGVNAAVFARIFSLV